MFGFLKKMLGGSNDSLLKPLMKTADAIEALGPEYEKLSDEALAHKTVEFKARYQNGETLDQLLPEAFATVREAAWRTLGMRPFRVQLIGGIVLHQGRIAEMKTGEGKTLTATLPAYLNALAGNGVHIVTVNDYLASFQGEEMGKLYRFLGLSVGIIVHDLTNEERRAAYQADITYGTNNEMGFDYLRDNMVLYEKDMVQRGHAFAIVDEVDSILIDEARTPLIISGQGEKPTDMYEKADQFVSRLHADTDYTVDEKDKAVIFTEEGSAKAERAFGVENLSDPENNRPPPGHRSQGTRQGRARKQDPGHHHLPELLPHVQEAVRHDRHGQDGGRGIPGHLPAGRRPDPDQHADDPQGSERCGVPQQKGQVRCRHQ